MKVPTDPEFIQQLSIDCVIFGYQERQLKVLVRKLALNGDFWALPSGFIAQDEGIDEAAHKILEERTGLAGIFLEQFRVFGHATRKNTSFFHRLIDLNREYLEEQGAREEDLLWLSQRFVSIGYYALVDIDKVTPLRTFMDESIAWYNVHELPPMIIDHNEIVATALETIRLVLDQKLVAFRLLPETFTMREIQDVYETILGTELARNNFPKKILDLNVLERLEKKYTGAANKAPYLYRLISLPA